MHLSRLALTAALTIALLSPASAQTILHVAPDGSDAASGEEAAPFATLARARDEVRAIKQRTGLPEGGIRVLIRDGLYMLEEPLSFAPEDSGAPGAPIVYAAALSAGLPPTHPLSDAPLAVSLGNGRVWTPRFVPDEAQARADGAAPQA